MRARRRCVNCWNSDVMLSAPDNSAVRDGRLAWPHSYFGFSNLAGYSLYMTGHPPHSRSNQETFPSYILTIVWVKPEWTHLFILSSLIVPQQA